jgi:peptidylprolyl isomerase
MVEAKYGDTVRVHYTGKFEDGTVFDSSTDQDPLEFTLGQGQLIPGFEQAVMGMIPGQSKTEAIPAAAAYGPRHQEMVVEIDREQMPANMQPEVGQQLEISQNPGEIIPVVVAAVSENKVILDANHPLAGENLVFDIQLLEIT